MILKQLKQEKRIDEILKGAPNLGERYENKEQKHSSTCFCSSCKGISVGYKQGPKNSYLDKLSKM